MKICFICGSFEPGYDGVGDYVRKLIDELGRSGHQPGVISLFDRYVEQPVAAEQCLGETRVKVLRLPSAWPAPWRFKNAASWINENDPDWISLQYVPFSFHLKGLHFGMARQLQQLVDGRRWHLMFHEIWMGISVGEPLINRLKGYLQRRLITEMIYRMRPDAIHTHCNVYREILLAHGIAAGYLPLFSNITAPVNQLPVKGTIFRMVHFGTVHKKCRAIEFAVEINRVMCGKQDRLVLELAGAGGKWSDDFQRAFECAGIEVIKRGRQPEEKLSALLASAMIGISTMPAALSQKSGSIAAMRAAGLQVICIASAWKARYRMPVTEPAEVIVYRPGNILACLSNKKAVRCHTVSEVSVKLATALSYHT